jgi:predicted  nucleic acid-binding Zn-ribbon protein
LDALLVTADLNSQISALSREKESRRGEIIDLKVENEKVINENSGLRNAMEKLTPEVSCSS